VADYESALQLPVKIYSVDRGYYDAENHYMLEILGLKSVIHFNRYRTEKKHGNKEIWIAVKESTAY